MHPGQHPVAAGLRAAGLRLRPGSGGISGSRVTVQPALAACPEGQERVVG